MEVAMADEMNTILCYIILYYSTILNTPILHCLTTYRLAKGRRSSPP